MTATAAIINPYRMFKGAFLPNAILECEELSQSAKLMWARLAQFSGKNGKCYPKMTDLAKGIGVSEAQAKRVIKQLSEQGFIMVIPATGKKRLLHYGNNYIFLDHPTFSSDKKRTTGGVTDDTPDNGIDNTSKEVAPVIRANKENHIRESIQIKKEETGGSKVTNKNDLAFEEFWKAYPKKRSKGQARKTWKKLNPGKKLILAIMAGLGKAKQSHDWEKDHGTYIPYPATFLNAEKWEDDFDDEFSSVNEVSPERRAQLRKAHNLRMQKLQETNRKRQEKETEHA